MKRDLRQNLIMQTGHLICSTTCKPGSHGVKIIKYRPAKLAPLDKSESPAERNRVVKRGGMYNFLGKKKEITLNENT